MKLYKFWFCLIGIAILGGCHKYLDTKPDVSLRVPETLEDLELMLNNTGVMNLAGSAVPEGFSDNIFLYPSDQQALTLPSSMEIYTWGAQPFIGLPFPDDWSRLYQVVNVSNVVLEKLEKIQPAQHELNRWEQVKGTALFFRTRAFLESLVIWGKGWQASTAATDPGIPLKLTSDYNEPINRQAVSACFEQMETDITTAIALLNTTTGIVTKPNKAAACALAARIYLYRSDFDQALKMAEAAIGLQNSLLDFNTLNTSAAYPVPRFNEETIFYSYVLAPQLLTNTRARIDTLLVEAFHTDDLRLQAWFRSQSGGTRGFKGGFSGGSQLFTGFTVGEMMLVKAECLARLGSPAAAVHVLDQLLVSRYKKGKYQPLPVGNAAEVLEMVLMERRKETIYRCLRWYDLKRLQGIGEAMITLQRQTATETIKLLPGDNRYAAAIPELVIQSNGIAQNPR